MKQKTATLSAAAPDEPPKPLRVAYHDGPPEIGYAGLTWRRGEHKEITDHTWTVMKARGDFAPFDFRIEPDTPAGKE